MPIRPSPKSAEVHHHPDFKCSQSCVPGRSVLRGRSAPAQHADRVRMTFTVSFDSARQTGPVPLRDAPPSSPKPARCPPGTRRQGARAARLPPRTRPSRTRAARSPVPPRPPAARSRPQRSAPPCGGSGKPWQNSLAQLAEIRGAVVRYKLVCTARDPLVPGWLQRQKPPFDSCCKRLYYNCLVTKKKCTLSYSLRSLRIYPPGC